jgi:LPS-assembly protein
MILQLLLLTTLGWSQSRTDGILIKNADSMYSDSVKKTVKLEGHVQVGFHQQSLNCDVATVNLVSQSIEAEGHVVLETLKVHIEGTRLKFNYKTNTGIIYDGFVQSGQVIFQGELIEKTGPDTFVAQNAEYTSCETCPPGWQFSGKKIEAEMGGYAYITRPVFKVGGVPIFIFPAMMVPLKSSRQSGFLVPAMDYSKLGGWALGESFFWSIDRSRDLTLTAKSYEKRGIKFHEDFRYVLSENSKGRLEGAILDDRALKNEYLMQKTPDRWFLHYRHQFDLPDDFVHRADIRSVSDLRYPRDFHEEILGYGDPSLDNRLSITKNTETTHMSAEAVQHINMLKYWPMSDNSDAVHRMPSVRFSTREERIGSNGPMLHWDLNYVNFARDKYSYDNLTQDPKNPGFLTGTVVDPFGIVRNGSFNSATDVLRTGQRLDIRPTISYPFQIANRFDILPSIMYRETQYRFTLPADAETQGYGPTAARRYFQFDIAGRTEFSNVIGPLNDEKATRWKHSVEPEVAYSQIPWMRSPSHPFFGNTSGLAANSQMAPISDTDIVGRNRLQFDYDDRVFDRQLVTLGLTNKVVRKRWKNGDPTYDRIALFRVAQSYDFTQVNQGMRQPWSSIDSALELKLDRFETYSTASYNPYANVASLSSTSKYFLNPFNYLLFNYSHSYLIDDHNRVEPGTETEDYGPGMGMRSRYADFGGVFDINALSGHLQSFEYFVTFRPPGNCWHIKMTSRHDLGGETVIRFTFNLDFTGGHPEATNSSNATQI